MFVCLKQIDDDKYRIARNEGAKKPLLMLPSIR